MENHSHLYPLAPILELHHPENRLVERSPRLNNIVVYMVHRSVDRDASSECRMSDPGPSRHNLATSKRPTVRQDVNSGLRQ